MNKNLPKDKKLVTISKAADILGVSIDTIRRWEKAGTIICERPNGKDRLFSIEELEKHKSSKPLSISEASEHLGISTTTLRRLEKKGLIKPERNGNSERMYSRDSLKEFLDSKYFLKKKSARNKAAQNLLSQEDGAKLENSTPEEDILKTKEEVKPKVTDRPSLPSDSIEEEVQVYLSPLQRLPEITFSSFIFGLLFIFAFKNILISSGPEINLAVLGERTSVSVSKETPTAESKKDITQYYEVPTVTPTPTLNPGSISTQSADLGSNPSSSSSANTKAMVKIVISNASTGATVNIRQKPEAAAKIIGSAKDGDTFEFLFTYPSWYGIKLSDGKTGYVSSQFVKEEVSK